MLNLFVLNAVSDERIPAKFITLHTIHMEEDYR